MHRDCEREAMQEHRNRHLIHPSTRAKDAAVNPQKRKAYNAMEDLIQHAGADAEHEGEDDSRRSRRLRNARQAAIQADVPTAPPAVRAEERRTCRD